MVYPPRYVPNDSDFAPGLPGLVLICPLSTPTVV